jgi:hypothetical protein
MFQAGNDVSILNSIKQKPEFLFRSSFFCFGGGCVQIWDGCMQIGGLLHLRVNSLFMSGKFQIRIPSPCQENWDSMRPEEKGRHCASCQKTVIDFTGMSDGEIISQLAKAGQGVCGRMAPDQLNRDLSMLPPPHMNGVRGWPLMLAGVLLTAEASGPKRAAKADVIEQSGFSPKLWGCDPVVGKLAARDVPDTIPIQGSFGMVIISDEKPDTPLRLMGDTTIVSSDMLKPLEPEGRESTIKDSGDDSIIDGGIQIVASTDSPIQRIVDTVRQWAVDSLAAIRSLPPERGLSVYPNPVRRGNVLCLSWKAEPGDYRVGLFNISGGLVKEQEIVVSAKGQVNLLEIPAGLGAGVYVIRAMGAGGRSITRELVIQ